MTITTSEFGKRAAIAIALTMIAYVAWYIRDFFLILVGALVTAMLLELVSEPLVRWCRLPRWMALTLSCLVILAIVFGCGFLFGERMSAELGDVFTRADASAKTISGWLQQSEFGRLALSHLTTGSFSLTSLMSQVIQIGSHFLEAVIFILFSGIYLAAQPDLYRKGTLYLFPPRSRDEAEETLFDIGRALRLWLLGQIIQMLLIGLLSTIAVWAIGLPSPLALGAIAAICEFVPYLGPIIAGIPAALVAFTQGLHAVLWTVLAYLIVHQIEGNLVAPLIQRHMVLVPPATLLLSIVAVSLLFGNIAIIFAAPVTVIAFVAVKKIYVRDRLGQPTSLPGESEGEAI